MNLKGRGRPELAAASARRRDAQPRQVRGLPARSARHLPRLCADSNGCPPRPRGSEGDARLRYARRVARGLRGCAAAACGRGDRDVAIKQLVEDFARYLYLPRLMDSSVLLGAIREGLGLLTWEQDAFSFADNYDENAVRYRGLRGGQLVSLADADAPGLLLKLEVARKQLDAESVRPLVGGSPAVTTASGE